jgi:hypothetical protein
VIFRKELAEKILRGEKTATRRVMNDNPRSPWYRHTKRYPVGMVFAVQPGRAKHGIAKARIGAAYTQKPLDITYEQVREEGFKDKSEFWAVIHKLNPGFDLTEPMHVREFELVPLHESEEGKG